MTINYEDGSKYVGEYTDGSYNGLGTHTYPDGIHWEGQWKDDKRVNGKGSIKYSDGSAYEGLSLIHI